MNECLPCELHKIGRKTLKEEVIELVVDCDHDMAMNTYSADEETNRYGDLYEEMDCRGIFPHSIYERSDAAFVARNFREGLFEIYTMKDMIYIREC